jgi:hypothetical protein
MLPLFGAAGGTEDKARKPHYTPVGGLPRLKVEGAKILAEKLSAG